MFTGTFLIFKCKPWKETNFHYFNTYSFNADQISAESSFGSCLHYFWFAFNLFATRGNVSYLTRGKYGKETFFSEMHLNNHITQTKAAIYFFHCFVIKNYVKITKISHFCCFCNIKVVSNNYLDLCGVVKVVSGWSSKVAHIVFLIPITIML